LERDRQTSMNVLHLSSGLEVTGAEVYAVLLADALIAQRGKAIIAGDTLTTRTDARYVPMDLNHRSVSDRLRHIRALVRLIREERIDLIHAHERAGGWVGYVAAKIAGCAFVTTVHGKQPTHLSRRLFHAFGDTIIAVCEEVSDQLVDQLGVPAPSIEV